MIDTPVYAFCGQPLSPAECQLIQELTRRYGRLSRHALAQTVCELTSAMTPTPNASSSVR